MDELWQRHKTFILQCVIGGFVFLIALVVLGNAYSDVEAAQASNRSRIADLKKDLDSKQAPSRKSIDEQKRKAEEAQRQIRIMGGKVASLVPDGEEYVRENAAWVFALTGKTAVDAQQIVDVWKQIPLAAYSNLRAHAQRELGARAAQRGKQIDDSLGAGVDDDAAVPGGMHALAIMCEVVARALDRPGVTGVGDFRMNPNNALDRDLAWIGGVEVRMSVSGDPDDVMHVLRSFNTLDSVPKRMMVLREIESITRRTPDEDDVKAVFVIYGLRMSAEGEDR